MSRSETRHIALLRAINVGGKNSLPMKELAAMFADAGARDVTTYIQSGNVVFSASSSAARSACIAVTASIAKAKGFDVPIVLRTEAELRAAVAANPFLARGVGATSLHLACLAHAPAVEAIASLDAARFEPDEFVVIGRDIHLHLPNGVGKSKLTNAYFDRALATTSTLRNWRTVETLIRLAAGET